MILKLPKPSLPVIIEYIHQRQSPVSKLWPDVILMFSSESTICCLLNESCSNTNTRGNEFPPFIIKFQSGHSTSVRNLEEKNFRNVVSYVTHS